jgi:hypothetical protein
MCVYPIWLVYRVAFASMLYLCELSTVLILSTCLSFLFTQGNKRQTPAGIEVILAWNIIHNIFSFPSNYCRESDQSYANSDGTVSCGYRGNAVYLWKCGEGRWNLWVADDRRL